LIKNKRWFSTDLPTKIEFCFISSQAKNKLLAGEDGQFQSSRNIGYGESRRACAEEGTPQ
jgi:hypothetical protein